MGTQGSGGTKTSGASGFISAPRAYLLAGAFGSGPELPEAGING